MIPELLQFIINSYRQNFFEEPKVIILDRTSFTMVRKSIVTSKFYSDSIFTPTVYVDNIPVRCFRGDKGNKFKIEIK